MEKELIRRVESKGGAHYAELWRDKWGFSYSMTGGGGSFGNMNEEEARREFEARVIPVFQPDANTTYRDVFCPGDYYQRT